MTNTGFAPSAITPLTSDGNILGSVSSDTFSYQVSGQAFDLAYVGTTTYTVGGTTFQALVGSSDASGSTVYYMFYDDSQTAPTASTVVTITPASTTNAAGEWDLNTNAINCFLAGTLLRTPEGERAVETLRVGDLVLTADGASMSVRWVGCSVIAWRFADPDRTLPIRIKAGALDENVPARDLLLSPGHAVLIDGVLVHAAALVNGTSIRRETDMPEIFSYYHIELDTHALLLAEGAPAESFLDGAEGFAFANAADRAPPPNSQELPVPRARSMRQLPLSVRNRLAAHAAALTAQGTGIAA